MENLNNSYSMMQDVYSGNMDSVNELAETTEDLTDVQEDNVDGRRPNRCCAINSC